MSMAKQALQSQLLALCWATSLLEDKLKSMVLNLSITRNLMKDSIKKSH